MNAPQQPITLSRLSDPKPDSATDLEFETVKSWARNWLSKSHPDLGRKGPVCPFTGPSISKDLFLVSFIRGAGIDRNAMGEILTEVARIFPTLPPEQGTDSVYKTVVLVLPEVTDFRAIDAVQLEYKNLFIRSGLMVGQFYPGCPQEGLWNSEFKPLDAPLPMLAIRYMVSSDYPFLCDNEEWMRVYFSQFAPEIPSRVRTDIVRRVTAA